MNFALTDDQWHEIYNCCDENIQDKIEVDGFGTTDEQQAALTEAEWIQIYLSVEEKRDELKAGRYGRDSVARKWREDMQSILEALDDIRAKFIGGKASVG